MAKYGSFKYGSGVKYGATSPASAVPLWSLIVDWDNDGYYSGENEASHMIDLSIKRGRDRMINSLGFDRYKEGRATVILDNDDGRYNPYNTSSPLYPHVTPGKKARLAVKEGSNTHELMRGKVADIQPYNDGNRKMVRIDIVDGQEFLAGKNLRLGMRRHYDLPTLDGMGTTGAWVQRILQSAEWPTAEWPTAYDPIADYNESGGDFFERLSYAWFWDIDALEAVRYMEDAEIGTFLHARDGEARFLGRHFTYDTSITLNEDDLLADITAPQPWETLRNQIEISVHPIVPHDVDTILWQIGGVDDQAIPVEAEGSFTTDAIFRYFNYTGVPVSASNPNFGPLVSFTVNSAADGSGTDLTSQCSVQVSEIADGATITLLNSSVTDGYIIDLQVYGDIIFAKYKNIINAGDVASKAIYDARVLKISSPFKQDNVAAQETAAFLLEHLSQPKPHPVVSLEYQAAIQFSLDLYVDRIRLVSPTMSIDRLYRIGAIEHKWLGQNGTATRTTLHLEPWFAQDAPSEYDYAYLNTFASSAEVDCSGSPAAGKMEWCFDPAGESSNFPGSYWSRGGNPFIKLYCSQTTADQAECATTGLSYLIPANGVLSFDYQWSDSDLYTTATDIYHLRLTTNTGVVYDEAMPVIVSAVSSSWTQFALGLSLYGGQTLTEIAFVKTPSFVSSDPDLVVRIDNVGLGIQIYP